MKQVKLVVRINNYSLSDLKGKYARFFGVDSKKVKKSDIAVWIAGLAKADIDSND